MTKQAEKCAASKRRLRRVVPVDYAENDLEKKKTSNRSQPKTELAKLKAEIATKVERMCVLKMELNLHNRLKDKICVDDLSEMEDLLDDSDSSDDEVEQIVVDATVDGPYTSAMAHFRSLPRLT